MTPERLREIGKQRHGLWWKAKLAREIGVDPRSITRWLAGRTIPAPTIKLLERLAEDGNPHG